MSQSRQLAAIMFTDIVGYTALMGKDEQKAFELLDKNRQIQKPIIEQYNGRWIKELGDGVMTSFNTASDAVTAAIKIQEACNAANRFQLKIGIHLGEVVFENDDVYGDGVNIASRIETLGVGSSILMSKTIRDQVKNNSEFQIASLGSFLFKNVDEPVEVFALSNPGFVVPKREQMKGKLKENKKKLGPRVWITAIFLLAVSVFLISYLLGEKKIKSIAILAFEDISPGHDQEYLGDGIANSVHALLSHLKDLKVIGRTSSFSFKGKNTDLVTIGKSLKTKFILEGTVQRIGDFIKIYVALINASDGARIWSDSYGIKSNDTFNVQDNIAQSIVKEINVRLTSKEREMLVSATPTTSLNYEDYLKGQSKLYKLTPIGIDSAFYYFQLVLERDSNFAQGHAAMAALWVIKMQQGQISFAEGEQRVKEAVRKAKELDPSLSEVHYTLGLSAWLLWDWPSLVKELYEAIQIEPNHALAHIYLSNFQYILGKPSESDFHSRKALELEPLNPLFTSLYSMNLLYAGKLDIAVQILENNLKKFPDDEQTITTLKTAYHLVQRYEDAFAIWKKSFSLKGDRASDSILTTGYEEGGYHTALQRLAEFYVSQSKRPWSIATLYTRAGIKEKAFEWLNKAFEAHDANMPYLKVDPIFELLKNDLRYKELLKKINLPPD